MKLSEELIWRGFHAETTIKEPTELDERSRKFYLGADPSANSLTIGNLAALMMAACFTRHGYEPFLLVGGATGQIGDPKETGERDLKTLEEVEKNKKAIAAQMQRIVQVKNLTMVDNYDWFKDINYLTFLREIGKNFSMTQLLDRQFVQARIGEGGSGISYAEFSYTLIQGYDFLYLYRKYGVDLQLCGADQFGNCTSGIHLIKRLENGVADAWSTPLIIDPASGRKFGKSEGNAVWLDSKQTSILDFYQFWIGQPDEGVESLLKIYTLYDKPEIEELLAKHNQDTSARIAQKALALGATAVVHGEKAAKEVAELTEVLFDKNINYDIALDKIKNYIPIAKIGQNIVDILSESGIASSKTEARKLLKSGAISVNGEKISEEITIDCPALVKKGKNKFVGVK